MPSAAGPDAQTERLAQAAIANKLKERKTVIRSEVDALFQEDQAAREAITTHLKERTIRSEALATRAQTAFASFRPSRFSPDARARTNYVTPDGDLPRAQRAVVSDGVDAMRRSKAPRSMRLGQSDQLKKLIQQTRTKTGSVLGTLSLDDLLAYIELKADGLHFDAANSAVASCKAEIEAERRLQKIRGSNGTVQASVTLAATQEDSAPDPDAARLTPDGMVKDNVDLQMDTATSPESRLRYGLADRSDQPSKLHDQMDDVHANIDTFELRSGPSDVTSFHDFHNLQIAFEGVWTELFDSRLTALGRELYAEYVKLKTFSGTEDGTDPTVSTLEELKQLMAEIRSFSQATVENVSPVVHGAVPLSSGASGSDAGAAAGKAAAGAGAAAALTPFLPFDPLTNMAIGALIGLFS